MLFCLVPVRTVPPRRGGRGGSIVLSPTLPTDSARTSILFAHCLARNRLARDEALLSKHRKLRPTPAVPKTKRPKRVGGRYVP